MSESRAIEHFKKTGCILPDHHDEIAAWVAENNE